MQLLFKLNYALIVVPLMLFSLGAITLFASSPDKARSQLLFLLIGAVFYLGAAFFDYTITKSFWKYFLIFCTLLLIFVEIIGVSKLGSARWLDLGFVTFQPSELAKLCLIFTLSAYISSNSDFKKNPVKLLRLLGITLPLIVLVFLQPDLGTTIILIATLLSILFYSGISKMYFLVLLIIAGMLSAPLWHSLKDYQKIRVLVFLNPQLDVLGHGYNVIQSIISIGSGGFFGKGFAHGTQTQMNFLPVHWTDFIFASFSEEWGFIGVLLLVTLYAIFLTTILITALKVKDPYGSLISIGIFAVFMVQFTINVGMNLGLLPVTGITLPFVSHGGTSLIVSMAMVGMLQNIWLKERRGSH